MTMHSGQLIAALLAGLMQEGVTGEQIEAAVERMQALQIGEAISPDVVTRTYVLDVVGRIVGWPS